MTLKERYEQTETDALDLMQTRGVTVLASDLLLQKRPSSL